MWIINGRLRLRWTKTQEKILDLWGAPFVSWAANRIRQRTDPWRGQSARRGIGHTESIQSQQECCDGSQACAREFGNRGDAFDSHAGRTARNVCATTVAWG